MQLIEKLNLIIEEFSLLKHRFYQAWSKGELSIEDLRVYAGQYYEQVSRFPRFISKVHTNCPNIEARKILLENLLDEELHGTDHPALWMQFAQGLGLTSEVIMNQTPEIETKAMVDTYDELAQRDWRDGLCALYAYECQVPEVSASKIAGLKAFYGIDDAKTLEFFTAHEAYDVEHSAKVADLITRFVEPERAERAVREAAKALWGFLDGMCRVSNIQCEMETIH